MGNACWEMSQLFWECCGGGTLSSGERQTEESCAEEQVLVSRNLNVVWEHKRCKCNNLVLLENTF